MDNEKPDGIFCGSAYIPHPKKAHRGGEDAFFYTNPSISAIGVADGVGGWERSGINPKHFADDLMEFTMKAIEKNPSITPVKALEEAYEKIRQTGSCTVAVGIMDKQGVFNIANLGDSGFMVIRDGEIVFRTEEQQHDFNFPYQLGMVQGRDGKYYTHGEDRPKNADLYSFQLRKGDIIVAGSDGLFDNLWDEEIVGSVRDNIDESPSAIAKELAQFAHQEAKRKDNWIPFGQRALEAKVIRRKEEYLGGKMDDITVVVGYCG